MEWTKEEENILKEYYKKVKKEVLIEKLNHQRSWMAIQNRVKILSLGKKRENYKPIIKWTPERIETLRKLWASGTTEEIKMAFPDFSYDAVGGAANRFGIKRDESFKYSNRLTKLLEENNYNYYWLGFIISDGHLSNRGALSINLSVKDIDHMKKLADYLGVNIGIRKAQSYGKYTANESCGINVMDVTVVRSLKERFKINGSKTYNACSLECLVDDDNFLAFFCGLIDGDGCIYKPKNKRVSMLRIQCHSSWFDNLTMISKRLNKLYNFNSTCYIDTQGYTKFCMTRSKEIAQLKKEIDKLNLPYLERKWDKIE